jgi:hypothetical protein
MVEARKEGGAATTGSDGTCIVTGLADGSYTVKAVKSGYQRATYPSPVAHNLPSFQFRWRKRGSFRLNGELR